MQLRAPWAYLIVLGLDPTGSYSSEEIRKAYRSQVKKAHPDAGGSAEAFRKVREAWEGLG